MMESSAIPLATLFRRLAAPAYLPILFLAFSWSALTPAFPQYLGGLGAGVGAVGLIVAMKGIGQVVSDVPGGFILAAWGLRRVTVFSYIVTIGANAALIWSRSLPFIACFTFMSGFSTSILVTTVMATVRMRVPPEFRGRALSGVGGALRIGMLIGPVAGGVVADIFGVPAIFILRIIGFVAGLISFTLGMPPDERRDRSVPARRGRSFTLLHRGLRDRWYAVLTVGFGILVLSILRSSREMVIPLWGTANGLSPTLIGFAMSIGAAADLLLFIPAGIISDSLGRKAAIGVSLTVFSIGLLLLLPARSMPLFIAVAAVIGVGNGLGAGINMTTGADLAPDGAVAEFLGLWRLYGDLGSAAGPVLVGTLAAFLALAPAVAITAAVGAVGVGVVAIWAPETRDLR